MYEILKEISSLNEWVFSYARRDFQNLFNETEQKDKVHLFLDPVEISDVMDEYGDVERKIYSGSFMLLLSSDFDEATYDYKYLNYIEKLKVDLTTLKESLTCTYKAKITNWKTIEVVNIFDYNFDGVIVNYQIELNIEDVVNVSDYFNLTFEITLDGELLEGAYISILNYKTKETNSSGLAIYNNLKADTYNYVIIYNDEVKNTGSIVITDENEKVTYNIETEIIIPVPTNLTATTLSDTEIQLDWTSSLGVDGYSIEISTDGETFAELDTTENNTYTAELLTPATTYYFKIRAYKGSKYSLYTAIVNETTLSWVNLYLYGRGTYAGISELKIKSSEITTIKSEETGVISLNGVDFSQTSVNIPANTTTSIYCKANAVDKKITFTNPESIIEWGSAIRGWEVPDVNSPGIKGDFSLMVNLTSFNLTRENELTADLSNFSHLTYIRASQSINLYGDISNNLSLEYINIGFGNSTVMVDITNLTLLEFIYLIAENGYATGNISNLVNLKLIDIRCDNNITGSINNLTSLETVITLDGENTIYGNISNLISLRVWLVKGNNNVIFDNVTNATGLYWLETNLSNTLSETQVNQMLADVYTNRNETKAGAQRIIDLTGGGTTYAPTGQGLIDKSNLESAGWTITTRDNNNTRALFFGDSITVGFDADPQATNRFSALFSNERSLQEINYGISGRRLLPEIIPDGTSLYEMRYTIPEHDNIADYLFVYIGTNDANGFPDRSEDFENYYLNLLDFAINTRSWPQSKIKILTIFNPDPGNNPPEDAYNAVIKALDDIYTSIQILDTGTELYNDGDYSLLMSGVHPTNAGHALIASFLDANIL